MCTRTNNRFSIELEARTVCSQCRSTKKPTQSQQCKKRRSSRFAHEITQQQRKQQNTGTPRTVDFGAHLTDAIHAYLSLLLQSLLATPMLFLNSSFLLVVHILATAKLMGVLGFDGETRLLGQWKILVYSQRAFLCRNKFSYDPIGALYTLQILDNGRFILFPEKSTPDSMGDELAGNLVECSKRQRMNANTIHGSWSLR